MKKRNAKKMRISRNQLLRIERKVRRLIELEQGRVNYHRTHKSARQYSRKKKHKGRETDV